MTRLLPAHVLAFGAAAGLAFANAVRLEKPVVAVGFAAIVAAVFATVSPAARVGVGATLVALGGWWWGSARLDALDRSVLASQIGRAGRALVTVTGEARKGAFAQRVPARVSTFDGIAVHGERAQLELPLGRSPPQGALVSLLAVVHAPRGPSHGFDERTWLRRQGIHVVLKVDG